LAASASETLHGAKMQNKMHQGNVEWNMRRAFSSLSEENYLEFPKNTINVTD